MARYIRSHLSAPPRPYAGLQPSQEYNQPLYIASDSLHKEIKRYVNFAISSYCKPEKLLNASLASLYMGNDISIFHDQDNHEVIVGLPGANVHRKMIRYEVADKASFDGIKDSFVDTKLYKVALKLFSLVKEKMARIPTKHKLKKIVLVGHSTGGVVATLMANLFVKAKLHPSCLRVITYNQPRVGNIKFAKDYQSLNITTTRVVDPNDAMVYYPPEKDGWSHTGEEVHFDLSSGNFYFSNSSFHDGAGLNEFNEFLFYGYRYGLIGDRSVVYNRSWRNFDITLFC